MISKILIYLFAFTALLFPQQDLRVISSDQNSITLEYSPQFIDTSNKIINNQPFRNINLAFGYIDESSPAGIPAIPERRLVIGVPSEFGNSIRILNSVYKEIDGKVVPLSSFPSQDARYVPASCFFSDKVFTFLPSAS